MCSGLKPCPFCGGEAHFIKVKHVVGVWYTVCCDDAECFGHEQSRLYTLRRLAAEAWNRRAERTWHDFADELPPRKKPVLCRGKNGALYVGKPVTYPNGERTRKVWVPRGDQYRTPEKWMEIDGAY